MMNALKPLITWSFSLRQLAAVAVLVLPLLLLLLALLLLAPAPAFSEEPDADPFAGDDASAVPLLPDVRESVR